jgi:hypothetical protein
MKQATTIVLVLLLLSCKQEDGNEVSNQIYSQEATQATDISLGNYQFDEVIHYSFNDLKEEDIFVSEEEQTNSILQKVVTESSTSTLKDTVLMTQLEPIGFQKTVLSKSGVRELNLFLNRSHHQKMVYECIPIYRDILLLRRNNKTTDILKICFECLQSARISGEQSINIDISDYHYFESILKY